MDRLINKTEKANIKKQYNVARFNGFGNKRISFSFYQNENHKKKTNKI